MIVDWTTHSKERIRNLHKYNMYNFISDNFKNKCGHILSCFFNVYLFGRVPYFVTCAYLIMFCGYAGTLLYSYILVLLQFECTHYSDTFYIRSLQLQVSCNHLATNWMIYIFVLYKCLYCNCFTHV